MTYAVEGALVQLGVAQSFAADAAPKGHLALKPLLLTHVLWVMRHAGRTTHVDARMVLEGERGLIAEHHARPPVLVAILVLIGERETALKVEFGEIILRLLHATEQTDLSEPTIDGVERDRQPQLPLDVARRVGWLLVGEKCDLLIRLLRGAARSTTSLTILQRAGAVL